VLRGAAVPSSPLSKPRVSVAVAGAVVLAAAIAHFARRSAHPSTNVASVSAANAAQANGAEAPPRAEHTGAARITSAPLAPAHDAAPHGDALAALRRGLASEDEGTRIAAVEAAVSATAIETLDELTKFDLARDPETAPTVIHSVAMLGAAADGPKRDHAGRTLARWLRSEMKREGADVPGNVSNLVEALGNVGGREAVDALVAALDGSELPLHVETLAVTSLGELHDPRARGAIERFAARVNALPKAEGFDEELRVEAIAAARAALSQL